MDRYLAKVYNQSTPLEFYEKLYSQLRIMKLISSFNNSVLYKQLPVLKDSENKTLQDTYIMLRLFNFWQVGHLILNRFQVEPCKVEDSYTKTLARKCFDATQQDKSPIVVGNRTFEYYTDPNPLSIVGTYNTFDTNGYILPFHLGNKTEHDKSIQYFT